MTLESVTPYELHRPVRFWVLLFGTSAAPIFWTGQLMLGYAVTAQVCYPGDHPIRPSATGSLAALVAAFDAVAILASVLGGSVAWFCYRRASRSPARAVATERMRFLAIWGLFSSLWFLLAILFNTIASMTVPPCLG